LTLAPFCGALGQRAHYFQLDALAADPILFTFVWKNRCLPVEKAFVVTLGLVPCFPQLRSVSLLFLELIATAFAVNSFY